MHTVLPCRFFIRILTRIILKTIFERAKRSFKINFDYTHPPLKIVILLKMLFNVTASGGLSSVTSSYDVELNGMAEVGY